MKSFNFVLTDSEVLTNSKLSCNTFFGLFHRELKDTRPANCVSKPSRILEEPGIKVSFLFHFRDEEIHSLKLSLASLVTHTPKSLLREIIVLDDGSKHEFQKTAELFFSEDRFTGVGLQSYRSEKVDGVAAARMKAAVLATGNVLVFTRSDVVFNQGWAEPILEYLVDHPKSVVVPHMDIVMDGYR